MKKLLLCSIAVLTAGISAAGLFDPEYRGDENSVHVVFEKPPFFPPGAPVPLDPVVFETGPSSYPLAGVPLIGDYNGFSTYILLPNFIDELPLKLMRLQMTFDVPVLGADIFVEVFGVDPLPVSTFLTGSSDPFIPALEHFVDIEMIPNPDYEEIYITNFVDPLNAPSIVEIDTISIPEPASACLIALMSGGFCFIKRRLVV